MVIFDIIKYLYVGYTVHKSQLVNVKYLSAEIKEPRILSEFSDCIPKEEDTSVHQPKPEALSFKKKRVGVSTNQSTSGICGLQLMAHRCSNVEEIEIGYSSK